MKSKPQKFRNLEIEIESTNGNEGAARETNQSS